MFDNICVLNLLKNVHYKRINMAGTTYNITKGLKHIRRRNMNYKDETIDRIVKALKNLNQRELNLVLVFAEKLEKKTRN